MRVLLVEDDPATAQIAEMMLKSESYVCDVTDMGEDALEIGKLYDYDIIIMDLMLPDMDGYQVLRRLRAARVKTPVLILSGLNGSDDKIKGLGVGADDYLTKRRRHLGGRFGRREHHLPYAHASRRADNHGRCSRRGCARLWTLQRSVASQEGCSHQGREDDRGY